jgi:hypothetical protein
VEISDANRQIFWPQNTYVAAFKYQWPDKSTAGFLTDSSRNGQKVVEFILETDPVCEVFNKKN